MNIKISKETQKKIGNVMVKGLKKVGCALGEAVLSIGAEILVGYAVNKIVENAVDETLEVEYEEVKEDENAGE